ncbi:hypothetical protein LIER_09156 [Lithospermum erythrorhizon]|uniref:Uncharacterized protein n=1 Tax=Lithospermum erythrorhizon TaxID=34254 RepID=A0AAV3PIZ5_LITER
MVEARVERAVARFAAQTAEVEVKRLKVQVADLHAQHRVVGPPFSWNVVGAILTEFVLNYQDQVPDLPSLLEAYKQRFPRGCLASVPPIFLPSPSKSQDASK